MQDLKAKTAHGNSVNKPASLMAVRQTPYYHNCKLLSPDGTLLAIVDQKKLDWYSQRALGGKIGIFFFSFSINQFLEIISESPPTLRLYFEPKGKPQEDRRFYLAEKEDQCVVCGARQKYIRKHVIPHDYRKLVVWSACLSLPAILLVKIQINHIFLKLFYTICACTAACLFKSYVDVPVYMSILITVHM